MAEIQKALENVDARRLIVTASTFVAILGLLLGGTVTATVWVVRTTDKAAAIAPIQQQLGGLNSKLDTMQGSVNALMSMQATVAETKADVGSLKAQITALDTKLQTQDAWIQRLRDDLRARGLNPPPYPLGGQ